MSPADQFIFSRRTSMTTEPSGNAESPSLDAELALADSETLQISTFCRSAPLRLLNLRDRSSLRSIQDEGRAGSNPGKQDEG
ncbi:hypothetical protein Tco_0723044 [Tanacetum coccineum]